MNTRKAYVDVRRCYMDITGSCVNTRKANVDIRDVLYGHQRGHV